MFAGRTLSRADLGQRSVKQMALDLLTNINLDLYLSLSMTLLFCLKNVANEKMLLDTADLGFKNCL